MKIAVITFSYLPALGGSQINLHNLLCRLCQEHGFEPTLYIPEGLMKKLQAIDYPGAVPFRMKSLPPLLGRLCRFLPKAGQYLGKKFILNEQRKENYALWHAEVSFPAGYIVSSLPENIPTSMTCHGEDIQAHAELDYGLRLIPKLDRAIRESVKNIGMLATISSAVFEEFTAIDPSCQNRIKMIPDGVDFKRLMEQPLSKNELRQKLGFPQDKFILLTVGRNHPKKGYRNIPVILSHILQKRHDIEWHVIGKGCSEIANFDKQGLNGKELVLHEMIAHSKGNNGLALHEKIRQLPSRDLIDYYQAADIFICTSLLETFGMVQAEAMSAGLPVVTTDAPGCRDVVSSPEEGISVPVGKWQTMAEEISVLLDDPERMKLLSNKGRKKSLENYDWPVITKQYVEMFKIITDKNKP